MVPLLLLESRAGGGRRGGPEVIRGAPEPVGIPWWWLRGCMWGHVGRWEARNYVWELLRRGWRHGARGSRLECVEFCWYRMSALSQQDCLLRGTDTHRSIRGMWTHAQVCDSVCDDAWASMSVPVYLCSSKCKLGGKHRRVCVCVYLFETTVVFLAPALTQWMVIQPSLSCCRTLESTGDRGAGGPGVQAPLPALEDGLFPGCPANMWGCSHR